MSQRIEKIKKHFSDNNKVYIAAGVGIVIGAVSVLVVKRNLDVVQISDRGNNINVKNVIAKNVTVITTYLEDRTNHAIPVRCLETGEVFGSINRAATLLDLDQGNISRHLKNELEHVKNLHFEKVVDAA